MTEEEEDEEEEEEEEEEGEEEDDDDEKIRKSRVRKKLLERKRENIYKPKRHCFR